MRSTILLLNGFSFKFDLNGIVKLACQILSTILFLYYKYKDLIEIQIVIIKLL